MTLILPSDVAGSRATLRRLMALNPDGVIAEIERLKNKLLLADLLTDEVESIFSLDDPDGRYLPMREALCTYRCEGTKDETDE